MLMSRLTTPWFRSTADAADPVQLVKTALALDGPFGLGGIADAMEEIVARELWRRKGMFQSFGQFAISPHGLRVRSERQAKKLRRTLIDVEHYGEWLAVLSLIARRLPGRPKMLVNDEGFRPFYTVPTASTSVDRILLTLSESHPVELERLLRRECKPLSAAMEAGIVSERSYRYGGVCDMEAAAKLSGNAQAKLLCALFAAFCVDAQCTLIANQLETCFGVGFAKQWREYHKASPK